MIDIITVAACDKCRTLKMILKKEGIPFNEVIHESMQLDNYPMIYHAGYRFKYKDFIRKIRRGEII